MVVYRSDRDDSGVYGVVSTSVANAAQELDTYYLLNDKMSLCRIRNSFLIKTRQETSSCLQVWMS